MSLSTLGEIFGVVLSVFIMILLLALLGAMSAAGAAWLLSSLTALTFREAVMIGSGPSILMIAFGRSHLDLGVISLIFSTLFMTPVLTLAYALTAWPFASFSPLSYWEALLLTTGIGLVISYNMMATYSEISEQMVQDSEDSDKLLSQILSDFGNS